MVRYFNSNIPSYKGIMHYLNALFWLEIFNSISLDCGKLVSVKYQLFLVNKIKFLWKTELKATSSCDINKGRKTFWTFAGQEDDCTLLEKYGHICYGNVDAVCLALERWTYIVKGKDKNVTHVFYILTAYRFFFFSVLLWEGECTMAVFLSLLYSA